MLKYHDYSMDFLSVQILLEPYENFITLQLCVGVPKICGYDVMITTRRIRYYGSHFASHLELLCKYTFFHLMLLPYNELIS